MTYSIQLIGLPELKNKLDQELGSAVRRLADDLFSTVREKTPVDTGRAKSGWRKTVNKDNFEISNAVPYVAVLDRGLHMTPRGRRGSKQAPKGIIGPSLTEIKRKN